MYVWTVERERDRERAESGLDIIVTHFAVEAGRATMAWLVR